LVYLYFRQKNRSLVNAKLILEKKVAERTSELLKQKVELELANSAKDKLFSIISHDLRGPLVANDQLIKIIGMEISNCTEQQLKMHLNRLSKSSTLSIELVDDLLLWARSQSKGITINKSKLSVTEVVDPLLKWYEPVAQSKSISLVSTTKPNLWVHSDVNVLQTVLRNLISNAIKFTPSEGVVTIMADADRGSVIIAVSDNGVGMTPKEVNMLFDIGHILPKRGTHGEKGSGFGLVLCNEFIEMLNGEIWVESEKGKGSTFYISLPASGEF
jgi:two-component system, sensor histidine kinase and response regulator